MNNTLRLTLAAVICSVALTGCLKTRTQVRDEPREKVPAHAVPVAPQPVEQNNYMIDEIKNDMNRLNGRIEELERDNREREKTEKLKSASNDGQSKEGQLQKERTQQLELRLQELEKAHNALIDSLKKAPPPESNATNPEDHLKKARAMMEKGQYPEAVESLNHYLRSPKAKLIQEATFLKGEAYFASKEFKKAIAEFSKYQDTFKSPKKLPAALFRIAQCFEGLKSKDDAKAFYQEVADKFPDSVEGKKAKKKLK